MLPLWFFVVLIAVICYLLYVTRTTEEDIVMMSKAHLKRWKIWLKEEGATE